jgi:hypothetical protein
MSDTRKYNIFKVLEDPVHAFSFFRRVFGNLLEDITRFDLGFDRIGFNGFIITGHPVHKQMGMIPEFFYINHGCIKKSTE